MKVLLLGKTGLVGSALNRKLGDFADITAPERNALDLTDRDALRRMVAETKPDLIINAAAYTDVEKAEDEPQLAELVNAQAPRILADEAKKCSAALIHFSTDYVFNGEQTEPYDEDARPQPKNAYGRSKLAGEQAIRQMGVPHLIFRLSWIYDVRGRNFLLTILRLAKDQKILKVVDDQIGTPTPAGVIAEIVAAIIRQGGERPVEMFANKGGNVNLSCRGHTTWRDFAAAIVERARRKGMMLAVRDVQGIPSTEYWGKVERPKNSVLNLARLQQRFGLLTPSWESALDDVFADFKECSPTP